MSDAERRQNDADELRNALAAAYRGGGKEVVAGDNLESLSLRAIVAVGMRCAQRVRPLYRPFPEERRGAVLSGDVDRAIQIAAWFASGENVTAEDADAIGDRANRAGDVVLQTGVDGQSAAKVAADVAYAVADARRENAEGVLGHVLTAIQRGAVAIPPASSEAAGRELDKVLSGAILCLGDERFRRAVARDIQRLQALALGNFPDLGIGVPLGNLGDLWAN